MAPFRFPSHVAAELIQHGFKRGKYPYQDDDSHANPPIMPTTSDSDSDGGPDAVATVIIAVVLVGAGAITLFVVCVLLNENTSIGKEFKKFTNKNSAAKEARKRQKEERRKEQARNAANTRGGIQRPNSAVSTESSSQRQLRVGIEQDVNSNPGSSYRGGPSHVVHVHQDPVNALGIYPQAAAVEVMSPATSEPSGSQAGPKTSPKESSQSAPSRFMAKVHDLKEDHPILQHLRPVQPDTLQANLPAGEDSKQ